MKSHKDLIVWQKSIALASKIYFATKQIPAEERYGITSQMRRSAISVPSNIAEGSSRNGRADYIRYLHIARGSLAELETQVHIATALKLINEQTHLDTDIAEVGRLLTALIQKLRESRIQEGARPF
jgi:four helix bundle protein